MEGNSRRFDVALLGEHVGLGLFSETTFVPPDCQANIVG
jgi:hypothetical protein